MVISAFTVVARTTPLAAAPADQMTTGRSPDQLQGTFRITDLEMHVTQTVFPNKTINLIKIGVDVNKQHLTKDLTGNTHQTITIFKHLH